MHKIQIFLIKNPIIKAKIIKQQKAKAPKVVMYESGFLNTSVNFKYFIFLTLSTKRKNKKIKYNIIPQKASGIPSTCEKTVLATASQSTTSLIEQKLESA